MTDYTDAWTEWENLFRRRNTNPENVAAEFLRDRGYIVERPDTLSLPVQVARSGSWTAADGYRIKLHTRVTIGDRQLQTDISIEVTNAGWPAAAFSSQTANALSRAILREIEPQIEMGMAHELAKAKAESRD